MLILVYSLLLTTLLPGIQAETAQTMLLPQLLSIENPAINHVYTL